MRLFVAAELPDGVLDALVETQAALRECVTGRYVAPDSLHVTLAFLGSVDASRVPAIADALDDACAGLASFNVTTTGLGSFGRRAQATLWQGFSTSDEFTHLAQCVRKELTDRGFSFDSKTFLPHVTLMRKADIRSGVLPMPSIASGAISTVTLFKSDLSGPYPVYEPLHRVVLAESA